MEVPDTLARCAALVDSLGLTVSAPLDPAALCAQAAQRRARLIRLLPYPFPPGTHSGLWIVTALEDVIVYDQGAGDLVRDQAILHELAHILAGHESDSSADLLPGILAPVLAAARINPQALRRIMGRCGRYSDVLEQEAELIATLVQERAAAAPLAVPGTGPRAARALAAFDEAFFAER